MTDQPAAIQATFSDFRLVKGRKVAQLVLEIPLEQADAALSTLGGIPQPQSERWVALARLNGHVPEPKPDKGKERFEDLKAAMQAGIGCGEPAFWRFLDDCSFGKIVSEESAAIAVRTFCNVNSRRELNLDPDAAATWRNLERNYQAWLKVAE